MIETIISMIMMFISTCIDELFLLMLIFAKAQTKNQVRQVYWGKYIGVAILVGCSLIISRILTSFVPQEWILGLLGLILIFLGTLIFMSKEEEVDARQVQKELEAHPGHFLFWAVTLLTLATGGDSLGIYIPYFTSLTKVDILILVILYSGLIPLLCYLSHRLAKHP